MILYKIIDRPFLSYQENLQWAVPLFAQVSYLLVSFCRVDQQVAPVQVDYDQRERIELARHLLIGQQ